MKKQEKKKIIELPKPATLPNIITIGDLTLQSNSTKIDKLIGWADVTLRTPSIKNYLIGRQEQIKKATLGMVE